MKAFEEYISRIQAVISPAVSPVKKSLLERGGSDFPAIAMDANGDFAITWENADYSVSAQAFSSSGIAIGNPFLVSAPVQDLDGNADPDTFQTIAMAPDGSFVIVSSGGSLGPGYGNAPYDQICQGQVFESPF
jgi:hypothetical protein